jgi:hypothetical protein
MRERDELDDAMEAMSLLPDELEKEEAMERRERHDEAEDDVEFVLDVAVDMKEEATELRPGARKRKGWVLWGGVRRTRL